MVFGAFMLLIGPDNSQDTFDPAPDSEIFAAAGTRRPTTINEVMMPTIQPVGYVAPSPFTIATPAPSIIRQPVAMPIAPIQTPTNPPLPNPAIAPVPAAIVTPNPTSRMPVNSPVVTPPPTQQPAMGAPIAVTPTFTALRNYPFAIVYECDWKGDRINLTTKTLSHNVVRLCIEVPTLPDSEELVEISYLNNFIFTRQSYDDTAEPLDPLVQHAVLRGKPDPFGKTLLRCPPGTPVCRLATSLRPEFFTDNAFLVGTGDVILQFKSSKEVAGMSPITIYFLLSSVDIQEPITLGRLRQQQQDIAFPEGAGATPQTGQIQHLLKHEPNYELQGAHQKPDHEGRRGTKDEPLFLNKPPT